jgi:hypothetical protein
VDDRVLELAAYDLILGMDWLEQHNPMTCNWLQKWVQFQYQGSTVTLYDILPSDSPSLSKILDEQFIKLFKGNAIWALVAVTSSVTDEGKQSQYLENGIPQSVQKVIHEYAKLFDAPDNLPPSRAFDHAISLYPEFIPMNCRSYRYTPQQKDEIEKQFQQCFSLAQWFLA